MHITIDTQTLIRLLYGTGVFAKLGMSKSELLESFMEHKDAIWGCVFRTNRRIFCDTSNYYFGHMIRTDGVSCCAVHKRRGAPPRPKRKPRMPKPPYVDTLSDNERAQLQGKVVVGVDPGKRNLLYCSTEDGTKQCRQSQNQRCKETKRRKYACIELSKRRTGVIEGRTIVEWESDLSAYNSKTVSFAAFRDAMRAKLLVSSKISAFYEEYWFRKRKLNAHFNVQRSEARMLQRMKATFGNPQDVVIGIGDWEQRQHCKYKEPTKGKGFRETLRRGGYKVLLVDEFRTTKQCAHCQDEAGKCATFLYKRDPDTRHGPLRGMRLVHGLLLCQQCERQWTRDRNSAINIARLTRVALAGGDRPLYLSRSEAQRNSRKRKRTLLTDGEDDSEQTTFQCVPHRRVGILAHYP